MAKRSSTRSITLVVLGMLLGATMLAPAVAGPNNPATKKFVRKVATKKATKKTDALEGKLTPSIDARLHNDVTRHGGTTVGPDSASPKSATVACPAGKIATGGGATVVGTGMFGFPPQEVATVWSAPGSNGTSWSAYVQEVVDTGDDWAVTAYVLCATP